MTRRLLVTAFAVSLALGCSDAPRTIQSAKPIAADPAPVLPGIDPTAAPPTSDPAAVAIVTAALDAHTAKHPELLQKLKSVSFVRDGNGLFAGPIPVRHTWQVHAQWPDKLRFRGEFPGSQVISLCRLGDSGWTHSNTAIPPTKVEFTPDKAMDVKIDSSGEWLLLLFPLTEPTTKVAPAGDVSVAGKPAVSVRVWATGITDAVMAFDKESHLLVQVSFNGREGGLRVPKEVIALSHKSFAGVILPEKIVYKAAGNQLAEWTLSKLDPVPTIDPKVFDVP